LAKFHINRRGDAAQCNAAPGGCPFAKDEDHYASKEGARRAFERSMDSNPPAMRRIPHYTTTEKAFEGIPLAEEARIYKILTDKGVEYLPWRGREDELRAAYEPWKTISYEELAERNGRLEEDNESLRDALRSYDRSVKGSIIEGFAYERSEAAAGREALARYRATVALKGFDDKNCYAVLKKAEIPKASRPSLMRRIFSKD
jgi:hypothetical protein